MAGLRWSADVSRRNAMITIKRVFRALSPLGRLKLTRFLFAPPDLRTSDPSLAADIYAGQFVFAGRLVDTRGQSPFDVEPPSNAWADTLHSFGWLRHLQAANTPLARENGRTFLRDFIDRPMSPAALAPQVVSRRVMALLSQSPLVLDGADHTFYGQYLGLMRADARRLRDTLTEADDPSIRLNAAISLTTLGLCVEGAQRLAERTGKELGEELDEQILSDGGHVSRNPRILIDLMLDLLPLRSTYAARGIEAPSGLVSAIDRIVPHLKMLRHPDGSVALFNGMGASQVDALATIFASHGSGGRAATEAPYTGYQRLEAGQSVVIVDTGPAPPFAASSDATAGCLSFEFSHGWQRIFVNCGMPRAGSRDVPTELRATAAHNATTLAETSTCRFLTRNGDTRIIDGPRLVTAQRITNAEDESLMMTHNGYSRVFNIGMKRWLTLSADGLSLSGAEMIDGTPVNTPAGAALVTRFHLHPSLGAELQSSGEVLLVAARGPAWLFNVDGAQLQLDDSVFFAALDGPRRTTQIVLTANDLGHPVTWTMRRGNT